MRSLPLCLLLAFLSVPCACNRGDKVADPADKVADPAPKVVAANDADFLAPAYIPGGVTDDKGEVGYLANPKGGVDAVDLKSGKLLWHSDEASFPLIVHKDRLLAQESHDADPIRIVALDVANKGKRVMASDAIQLALTAKEQEDIRKKDPVTPGAELAERGPTFCRGKVQEGELHLIWRNSFFTFAARVDLATGMVTKQRRTPSERRRPSIEDYSKIAQIAADPKAFGVPQKLPKLAKLEDPQPRELFRFDSDSKMGGGTSLDSRWVAGDVLAVLLGVQERRRSSEVLVLWDMKTGKNLHSSEVLWRERGKGARDNDAVVYPAFHGRYVVHHLTASGFPDGQPTRPVKVFSLESRKWSPTIQLSPEAGNIMPAGPRLFFAAKGMLKAVDLALDGDGPPAQPPKDAPPDARPRILWERPVVLPVGLPSWEERREP